MTSDRLREAARKLDGGYAFGRASGRRMTADGATAALLRAVADYADLYGTEADRRVVSGAAVLAYHVLGDVPDEQ